MYSETVLRNANLEKQIHIHKGRVKSQHTGQEKKGSLNSLAS